jgi:hypothetical protein
LARSGEKQIQPQHVTRKTGRREEVVEASGWEYYKLGILSGDASSSSPPNQAGSMRDFSLFGSRMKWVKWAPNLASFAAAFCSYTMLDRA